ncbi:MAG: polyamine aminopropyltransferase [Spirochaetales bacterium]|nr:polyamine aminopropyltransferase [Leptospiraceae bacterium]MCP5483589.1 polyamine aminopropyltransferase [Spirochaetales bacterium]MCP5486443.1 polyamine aminopropyltransferase [Spirochaetales bacterium]
MKVRMPGRKWFLDEQYRLGTSPTFAWGLLRDRVVYRQRSGVQRIEIFDNEAFGRVLALDGLMQLSTRYEHVYHEMLVHPALLNLEKPRSALVIGGGDGGALRELLKHPLERAVIVEIDQGVIDMCREYLPGVSAGAFDDPRVEIVIEDARGYVERQSAEFDVIVFDATDAYGPSEALWTTEMYRAIQKALRRGGIGAFQAGQFTEQYGIQGRDEIRAVFKHTQIHKAFVACFPFDECAFIIASDQTRVNRFDLKKIQQRFRSRKLTSAYYDPDMHLGSTLYPRGWR